MTLFDFELWRALRCDAIALAANYPTLTQADAPQRCVDWLAGEETDEPVEPEKEANAAGKPHRSP
ncbi:MAG: hypothetical protein IPK82_30640 [Polyangiaceae bacterium]|nr:hypothetical protein [Polyangiaceae bacterium]